MAWRKSEEPKTESLSVKISPRQLGLLRRYVELKGLSSDAEGVRRMIDGVEAWLKGQSTQQDTVSADQASHQVAEEPKEVEADSGLPSINGYTKINLPSGAGFSDDGEDLPGD